LQQAWFQQACCKLMTSTSLLQLVDNLQQAGKIRNLQQVCGVSGCVDPTLPQSMIVDESNQFVKQVLKPV
jgi:hypothetical protein